jgi:molybdopterin-guanine dinucleotide biosynthesis protein A
MGRSKADLPFGKETMLQRVVRKLAESVPHIVVVAAQDQQLPSLPRHVRVVYDRLRKAGPLAGIAVGLAGFSEDVEAAFVTSCDVPFLNPSFVRAMLRRLGTHDLVIPFDESFLHPLAAVYRTSLVGTLESMLAAGVRRPRDLLAQANAAQVNTTELRSVDPELDTLLNLNQPNDYRRALIREGLPVPAWVETLSD